MAELDAGPPDADDGRMLETESPVYPAIAAPGAATLEALAELVIECRACPRLVAWREAVAIEKRASFRGQTYWGRPVPGFGDPQARIVIVGLAPAAHGANRTGRMFTGDRSGEWIVAALHRAGLARLGEVSHAGDGQVLYGTRMVAPVHCAPPDNKPSTAEKAACSPWLDRELELLTGVRAILALGGIAWTGALQAAARAGWAVPRPRPVFGHGVEAVLRRPDGTSVHLIGCYHVSQQNTFTGRLTREMLDAAVARAASLARPGGAAGEGIAAARPRAGSTRCPS